MTKVDFNKYSLEEQIGIGTTKKVWKARDTIMDRIVALKIFETDSKPNLDAISRIESMVQARAGSHQNITQIYDANVDETTGRFYIAEEYVSGKTIGDLGNLTVRIIRKYARDIFKGLRHLEDKGIVHGDLNSKNAMVNINGTVKITDFGSSFAEGKNEYSPGSILFMPPEYIQGNEKTTASDMWQAGVLLYKLATGNYPFTSSVEEWGGRTSKEIEQYTKELQDAILTKTPELPSSEKFGAIDRLDDVIMKCLSKNPQERPSPKKALWMLRRSYWYEAIGIGKLIGILGAVGIMTWYYSTPMDTNRLIYTQRQDDSTELFSIDPEGHAKEQLTDNEVNERNLALSNDTNSLLYVKGRAGDYRLMLRSIDSSEEKSVYRVETIGKPAWSHDDSQFAVFTESKGGERLVVFDRNGNKQNEIKCPTGADLQWHPNGRFLSYNKAGRLHLVTPDGKHRVTKYPEHVKSHAWTDRGLLISTHTPEPYGKIHLLSGEQEEFEAHRITNNIQAEELGATKIRQLKDGSGYWYLSHGAFMERKWDGQVEGVNLNDGLPTMKNRIMDAVEGQGEYFIVARKEDLDGSGKIDEKDNAIYSIKKNSKGWSIKRIPGSIGIEEFVLVPR